MISWGKNHIAFSTKQAKNTPGFPPMASFNETISVDLFDVDTYLTMLKKKNAFKAKSRVHVH